MGTYIGEASACCINTIDLPIKLSTCTHSSHLYQFHPSIPSWHTFFPVGRDKGSEPSSGPGHGTQATFAVVCCR